MLTIALCIQAGQKTCPTCGGLGHPFGRNDITCQGCGGRGTVPLSAAEEQREQRNRENYANSANDIMEQYGLTPDEYFAYEELVRQAMTEQPVYQTCNTCGGTGNCIKCGGYMNLSLDDDLCFLCGGSGVCTICRGSGQHFVGYQENPMKEQLIQQANEMLRHGSNRHGGTARQNSQSSSNGYSYGGDSYDDNISDYGENSSSSSRSGGSSSLLYILIGVIAAGVVVLIIRFMSKK